MLNELGKDILKMVVDKATSLYKQYKNKRKAFKVGDLVNLTYPLYSWQTQPGIVIEISPIPRYVRTRDSRANPFNIWSAQIKEEVYLVKWFGDTTYTSWEAKSELDKI